MSTLDFSNKEPNRSDETIVHHIGSNDVVVGYLSFSHILQDGTQIHIEIKTEKASPGISSIANMFQGEAYFNLWLETTA